MVERQSFLVKSPVRGGEGATREHFFMGRFHPNIEALTLSYITFDRKEPLSCTFHGRWYPSTYLQKSCDIFKIF